MENLTPAERFYKQHLKNVVKYQKRNPEKMQLIYQRRMAKLKANPADYQAFLIRRRESCKRYREKKKGQVDV